MLAHVISLLVAVVENNTINSQSKGGKCREYWHFATANDFVDKYSCMLFIECTNQQERQFKIHPRNK